LTLQGNILTEEVRHSDDVSFFKVELMEWQSLGDRLNDSF